jgi:hypothetical protein
VSVLRGCGANCYSRNDDGVVLDETKTSGERMHPSTLLAVALAALQGSQSHSMRGGARTVWRVCRQHRESCAKVNLTHCR